MRIARFLIKLLVTVLFLAILVTQVDLVSVRDRLVQARPGLLVTAVAVLVCLAVPQALRWRSILRHCQVRFPVSQAIAVTWASWFFSQALPSTVGGDAYRIWFANRRGADLVRATGSVVLDRFSAVIALLILLLVTLPWWTRSFESRSLLAGLGVLTVAIGVACALVLVAEKHPNRFLPQFLREPVARLSRMAIDAFRGLDALRIIGLAASIHLGTAVTVWLLARSIAAPVDFVQVLVLMPVVLMISTVPISIAGWGIREGAMVAVFGLAGMPSDYALSLSVLYGLSLLVASLPGGISWWWLKSAEPAASAPGA